MPAVAPIEAPRVASPGSPATVLVVDDNAGKRLAVRAMLAPLGHDVVEADSGRAALDAVQEQSFAVILMDVVMPILDGYETARLIRQRTTSQTTPIIFLTASAATRPTAACNGRWTSSSRPCWPRYSGQGLAFVHLFLQSEELQRSLASITALNVEMLARLAAAAELRDDDTGQHTRRVGNLSVAIAERLGVSALSGADPARRAAA